MNSEPESLSIPFDETYKFNYDIRLCICIIGSNDVIISILKCNN
jgi:hypothetical protein